MRGSPAQPRLHEAAIERARRGAAALVLLWLASCDLTASWLPSTQDGFVDGSRGAAVAVAASSGAAQADARATIDLARTVVSVEEEWRRAMSLVDATPAWEEASGANPFLVQSLGSGAGWLGLLRGEDRIVRLDPAMQRVDDVAAPAGASGWTSVDEKGRIYVVGERSRVLQEVRVEPHALIPGRTWALEGVEGLRSVTRVGDHLYAADRFGGAVHGVARPGAAVGSLRTHAIGDCPGAIAVEAVPGLLAAVCLLDRSVRLWGLDAQGAIDGRTAELRHDGPLWSVALHARPDGGVRLLLTGIEDHPLDRSDGSFGYIDSFAFVRDVETDGPALRLGPRLALNLSEHGVVTPKWARWEADDRFLVLGYGSDRGAVVELGAATPTVRTFALPPGSTSLAGSVDGALVANPLLDAWVRWDGEGVVMHELAPRRDAELVLGEALVFTTLMAPHNRAEGHRSRFTCEACHFEGTVDGRTHYTGRADVHATTKTLRGLVANRPHFTRALDRTTEQMIHNEFRVANRGSGSDPWFELRVAEHPWLAPWLEEGTVVSPVDLRRSVLRFLATMQPERNPAVLGRSTFSAIERRGADVFATHCEGCHQARRLADRPETRVPRAAWASHLFGAGDLLWASDVRVKTGVTPYVHREGARVPSLRRLFTKAPYLTNGSAATLREVLDRVDLGPPFLHGGADPARRLSDAEKDALLAFLRLL